MNGPSQKTPPNDPLEKLAWYMDQAFPIPGTKYRIGWDGILGLVPGAGEMITLIIQSGIVLVSVAKYPVPMIIALRMVINVLIDSIVGSIPLLGDIFDFAFKANTRNMRLLNEVHAHALAGKKVSTGRHYAFVLFIAALLLGIMVGVVMLIVFILGFLFRAIDGILASGNSIPI